MSGIHNLLLKKVQSELETALITDVADNTKAGVVKIGPLQGDPDPDVARISVELYYNDPDQTISGTGIGRTYEAWNDEVDEVEVGGCITWRRRFTAKVRFLFERSREDLEDAHEIASIVRSRMEKTLLKISFSDTKTDDEYVARPILSDEIISTMTQSGGPPDSYDFHLKIQFEILTSEMAGA